MPDRIIREELLESEAWLGLKDNADRSAWIAVALSVDNFGDMPAGALRLVRLWRCYGIDSPEKVARALGDLSDVDLIRLYTDDGKPYLHVPRFGQHLRWVGHAWPLSPWATDEEKQSVAKKSHKQRGGTHSNAENRSVPHAEVDLDLEVEEKKNTPSCANAVALGTPGVAERRVRRAAMSGHDASHDPGFIAFWSAYPKKRSKGDAEKAWAKLKPDNELAERIMTALRQAKTSPDWVRDAGRYIPHPASWLNGKRWEDDVGDRDEAGFGDIV